MLVLLVFAYRLVVLFVAAFCWFWFEFRVWVCQICLFWVVCYRVLNLLWLFIYLCLIALNNTLAGW